MSGDPVVWIAEHIAAGIRLREECLLVRSRNELTAWEAREKQWAQEARDGVAARSPRDVWRVDTLDTITPPSLPVGHPWYQPPVAGISVSSTGIEAIGNPFSCHVARIRRMQDIEREWRASAPTILVEQAAPRGRPGDKLATEARYRELAAEIDARPRGQTISAKCRAIAIRLNHEPNAQTIERETLPYRKKRGRILQTPSFSRR